ncbi:HlyD family efflux transporter periplasmic adaptor subunit [Desulfolithobacter sp.]
MKLRTRKSYLNNLPEGKPPGRILPRVTKFVYFLVLFSIVSGLLYLVALRVIFFVGQGQVVHEKTALSSTRGGKIVQLTKMEGESFVRGEVLATIALPGKCEDRPDPRITKLTYDIKSRQAKLAILADHLKSIDQASDSGILHRALEIGSSSFRRQQEEQADRAEKLREQIQFLKAEITVRQKELAALRQLSSRSPSQTCTTEEITAPFDGMVYLVKAEKHEYISRGKPFLVLIAKDAPVYIDAYIKEKYLRYIAPGNQMKIIFPDRYRSIGQVTDVTSSAQVEVKRLRKDYIPIPTMIRVKLVPLDPEEEKIWQKYDRIVLKVRGEKL